MADIEVPIKIKRSNTPGAVPNAGQLAEAELAANLADGKLFTRDGAGTVKQLAPSMGEHDLKAPLASPQLTGLAKITASGVAALTVSRTGSTQVGVKFETSDGAGGQTDTYVGISGGTLRVGTNGNLALNTAVSLTGHTHAISDTTGLQTALDAKAPLASPTFTGTPVAPTAAAGTNSTQIATTAFVKAAVDTAALGLYFVASVRALSLTNITIATPGSSIGGVTPANGERFLLAGQSTGSQNGIYVYNGAASAMTRSTDADSDAEVKTGLATYVSEGTYSGTSWTLTTTGTITLGTTALTFTQFAGGATITAGTGLTKSGDTISIANNAALPGAPTTTTATADDSSTKIATTAYVQGQKGTATPAMDGTAAAGTSAKWAPIDHVHPTDTTRAPLASPAFTGTPTAPTPSSGDNSTKIATTAWTTLYFSPIFDGISGGTF